MIATIWIHDAVDTGQAGLSSLADGIGHTARPLPELRDRPHTEIDEADRQAAAAIIVIRDDADRDLLAKLGTVHPQLPLLVLPVGGEHADCADLIALGATGALPWESPAARLRAGLTAVLAGCTVLPAQPHTRTEAGLGRVTEQEIGWLRLLARHTAVEDLAAAACVSSRTMHRHLKLLYRKLDATDRDTALAAAHRRHLL